jgi:glyceraldehyde 3-phosphate dehydrogenase
MHEEDHVRTIAIYGFGRIGRTMLRAALERGLFVPTHVGDVKDPSMMAALFEVDSNFGRWREPVLFDEGLFRIGDRKIAFVDTAAAVPDWGALGVDLVVDCSGRATRRENAQAHLNQGAKKVLVSAGSRSLSDCDAVLLPGINLDSYDSKKHHIVSMGSCTTNALAPVIKIVRENLGIDMRLAIGPWRYGSTCFSKAFTAASYASVISAAISLIRPAAANRSDSINFRASASPSSLGSEATA